MMAAAQDALASPLVREFVELGRAPSCPVIDMHAHIGGYYGGAMPSASISVMLARTRRAGVERLVASHHVALAYDVAAGNAQMAEVVRRHGDTILGYWVVNPNEPGGRTAFAAIHRTPGFVGLKLWPDYHLARVTSSGYEAALRYADEHGLLVLCHCWGGSPFAGPTLLAEVAMRYPNARIIAAHSGHGEWIVSAQAARDVRNFYLDLTSVPNPNDFRLEPESSRLPLASAAAAPLYGVIDYLVEVAGSEKIVFGSDLPWYSQQYHVGSVLFARISDGDRRNILRENAVRLLGHNAGKRATD